MRSPTPILAALALLLAPALGPERARAQESSVEEPRAAASRAIYSCGMHPQIVQDEPGTCPICGMDLSARKVATPGSPPTPAAGPKPGRRVEHWVAPLDPSYVSDRPGKSPQGMDLVPVYAEEGGGATVTIDPTVVQNMGVRIKRVGRGPIFRHVRTIGTVEVAEDELSVVNLRYSGWIERIFVDETGVAVEPGQPLFAIYSPELLSAQEEYLLALRSGDRDSSLARSARARLELWEISAAQIRELEARGRALRTLTVAAPQAGYVLHKDVVQGARVQAGVDLYRIGNLARIWVNAEVYEFDAPWVQLGQRATMELSFQKGRTYEGEIAYVYPTLNPRTRTLTVRLEFENPGLALKPGMFATVQIEAQRKSDAVVVPTEAILHSGTRQLVFVALELGRYEIREITTGIEGDRYVTEVLSGLAEGERVVTSGQFLLDSESQLQEAVEKLLKARLHAREPRAGAGPEGAAPAAGAAGHAATYWTCGMHPQVVQDGPGTCPICGMDLIEKQRAAP